MPLYLLPEEGDYSEVASILSAAQIEFIVGEPIRHIIIKEDESNLVVATVTSHRLSLMQRYAAELFHELPTVVFNAPNLAYPGEWASVAAAIPAIDWMEFETKVSKPGAIARTPEQLQDRGKHEGYGMVPHDAESPHQDQDISLNL